MAVKPVQPENAPSPIPVTLDGRAIDVRPVQPENAEFPIPVTLDGRATDVRPAGQTTTVLPSLDNNTPP